MPHKPAQNLFCRNEVIILVSPGREVSLFHNFTRHALCNSSHLPITSYVNRWKSGQRSTLPFQAINEASVLALHNVAGNIIVYAVISRASNCAERLERFQSVGIANVEGVKNATSDPHNVAGSIFIFHFSFMQVK